MPADLERSLDPALRPDLRRLLRDWNGALVRGDLEWLFEHTDPEIEVLQPRELPDAKRFAGHEGFLEAILDWPLNWDDFRMEWKWTFERAEGQIVSLTHQRGRSKELGIAVEADVVLLTTWRDATLLRWEMFMGPDAEALLQPAAASRSGAP